MERIISKYVIFLPYLIAFSQIFRIGGITHYGILLLHLCNLFIILTNVKYVMKEKLLVISCIYVITTILYQFLTPPLSELYNPYVKEYYYLFIETGISFWLIGYKDYEMLNKITLNLIYVFVVVLLIIGYCFIYIAGDIALLDFEMWDYTYQLLPYLFLWLTSVFYLYRSKQRFILMFIFIVVILLSTKRGPLVSFSLGFFISGLLLYRKIKVKRFLTISLVCILFFYILYIFFYDYLDNWVHRWTEEDDISSGRDDIWTLIWIDMLNKDVIGWLFGSGFEASHILTYRNLWGAIGAHNDFLDILYNMGLMGEGIFIALIVKWILIIKRAINYNFDQANLMIYLFVCFIMGSYVSSNLTRFATVFFGLYFYYFAGRLKRNTSKSNLSNTI